MGERISALFMTGHTHTPIQWVSHLFGGVKRSGSGADQPPSSSAKVKERVELYNQSPSGSSWLVLGRNLFYFFDKFYLQFINNVNES